MNNFGLTLILLCCLCSISFAQSGNNDSDWRKIDSHHHQRGKWLIGAGPTILGAQAKAGKFVANRTWIGLEGAVVNFFSQRQEVGLSSRYYLWNGGFVSGFAEAGFSYGRFKDWVWEIEQGEERPGAFYSPKINTGLGLEYTLTQRFSLEGIIRVSKLTQVNRIQPSFQGSLNFYFRR
jgi:hypothetical protein